MSGFREIFEAYGADYESTMTRFVNNQAMYLRLLTMFFKDENLKLLGEALEASDYKKAFEAAHTLKGVTANMGLTPLFDKVCDIVEPLRAGDEQMNYMEKYQELLAEYERVRVLLEDLEAAGV